MGQFQFPMLTSRVTRFGNFLPVGLLFEAYYLLKEMATFWSTFVEASFYNINFKTWLGLCIFSGFL
jgi:hypothetical protein